MAPYSCYCLLLCLGPLMHSHYFEFWADSHLKLINQRKKVSCKINLNQILEWPHVVDMHGVKCRTVSVNVCISFTAFYITDKCIRQSFRVSI